MNSWFKNGLANWKSIAGVILGALIIGAAIWLSGPASLARIIEVSPLVIFLVLSLTLLLALVSSCKWGIVLREVDPGSTYPMFALFRVVLFGLVLGLIVSLEVGSASSRIAYLSQNGKNSLERASFSVFLDRWFDLLALASLVLPSGLFLFRLVGPLLALCLMALPVVLLLALSFLWPRSTVFLFSLGFTGVCQLLRRLFRRRGAEAPVPGQLNFDMGRVRLLQIVGLSYARIIILGLRSWVVMLAVGINLPHIDMLLLVPVVQLTLIVPLTPGGLGLYEAGWYGVLLLQGVSAGEGLVFVVLQRVLSAASLLCLFTLTQSISWLKRYCNWRSPSPQSVTRP
jgi:uncharacterized membrane protein YbhN (UPF0104 family)